MHIPPSGMVRDSSPHFDQTLNQPVNGPLNLFAPDIELPNHMEEIIGQNPHLQPGLVGLEPLPAGLVPTQSVFAFLDSVFHIAPPVVDLDHLAGWQPGVSDQKTDPGEKLTPMPLDLGHYPAGLAPALCLVLQKLCPHFG